MQRILVVLRGTFDAEQVRRRYVRATSGRTAPHELAVCLVLDVDHHELSVAIDAQRRMTMLLRRSVGDAAEGIAVFVASEMGGYDVGACARDWGATIIDDGVI